MTEEERVADRPTDGHILDLAHDPAPGGPRRIRERAGVLHDVADDVGEALGGLKGNATEHDILSWPGKTARSFAEQFGDAPRRLRRLRGSCAPTGDALAGYWPGLETARARADRALREGREAHRRLAAARAARATPGVR